MSKHLNFYIKNPKTFFNSIFYYARSFFIIEKYDLVIVDDIFPNSISSWRFEEFSTYLNLFKSKICLFSTGHSLGALNEPKDVFEIIKDFRKKNPEFKNSVKVFQSHRKVRSKLGYFLFLDNANIFLNFFEKNKIPFVFTLYPGAGLMLDDHRTDLMLRRVMGSEFFKGVITTQNVTTEYLLKKNFCDISKINFIYGVVSPKIFLNLNIDNKIYFENGIMNICFVANKQMEKGRDKGYDVFIEAAKILVNKIDNVFFHVVGPFDEDDIEVIEIKNKIKFYGFIKPEDLPLFFSNIDLIISPNKPFILKPGAFDGFPTAACSEAALNGVALAVTDPLKQNIYFKNDEDIIIIEADSNLITDKIISYYHNPEKLKRLAINGKIKFNNVYSIQNQMDKRIDFLTKNISK